MIPLPDHPSAAGATGWRAPSGLVATGDAPGHSQVLQFINEDGKLNWDSEDQFTVIDSSVMPLSQSTLATLEGLLESSKRSQR